MLRRRPARVGLVMAGIVLIAVGAVVQSQLPAIGAGGLLHPFRRSSVGRPPDSCDAALFDGVGVQLKGWRCRAAEDSPSPGARRDGVGETGRRGTLVYLHGIADNRASAAGIIDRFSRRGFDVIAYDSRAHGESDGAACTFGFYEKEDLRRVVDTIDSGPVVLMGTSLGAAVALQEAADDARIRAVVAAETFSDLRTVAIERAQFFFTPNAIRRAFQLAEAEGRFSIEAVSPETAARKIQAPVLIIHGSIDRETSPDHSRRVFEALHGPRQLILVPNAGHNQSLTGPVWQDIETWLDRALSCGVSR
jgi:alpha-beta hydrolase superfamily lysophospholipase